MGFSTPSVPAPPPPPPAANPPTYASGGVQSTGAAARARAAAASGAGFEGTLLTTPQGASAGNTAQKALTGQ